MADVLVKLEGVRKVFGGVTAVQDVSLDVYGGEFFSLLGPSGSGKTTCLRMIAGFEAPSSGRILLQGDDVSALPPYERDVNTVFQDYALFPHMSVAQNVEYGLKVKRVPRDERRGRVAGALESVQLEAFGKRKPGDLSGGQRQRVALARALVNEPEVLLLDEPLGALDLKLRQQMQVELKSIQESAGITFIYVTHDQEEALTMSDRLAVMNGGRIEQVGTPSEVYEQPSTSFVAGFVGVSNVLSGPAARSITGDESDFTIRPEKIVMSEPGAPLGNAGDCTAKGRITDISYLGAFTRYTVGLDNGGQLVVTRQNSQVATDGSEGERGRSVVLTWAKENNRPLANDNGTTRRDGEPGKETS
ncbi:MAG: ABC transporter ATP-binding protein [Actinobacteria bacterium]|nr:ABC transporter ATP-binding protein [Actinomycetota bacterium]